jgi:acetyl esterase
LSEDEGRETDPTFTVIYDGHCPLCLRSVAYLRKRDREGVLEFITFQDPSNHSSFPWISEDSLRESLKVVSREGVVHSGGRGVEELVRILPSWRWGGWLFRLPLVRTLTDRGYRWVARHRSRIGCDLHSAPPP